MINDYKKKYLKYKNKYLMMKGGESTSETVVSHSPKKWEHNKQKIHSVLKKMNKTNLNTFLFLIDKKDLKDEIYKLKDDIIMILSNDRIKTYSDLNNLIEESEKEDLNARIQKGGGWGHAKASAPAAGMLLSVYILMLLYDYVNFDDIDQEFQIQQCADIHRMAEERKSLYSIQNNPDPDYMPWIFLTFMALTMYGNLVK